MVKLTTWPSNQVFSLQYQRNGDFQYLLRSLWIVLKQALIKEIKVQQAFK